MTYRNRRARSRLVLFAVAVSFAFGMHAHAAAGLTITEIMYDPSGSDTNREWVEVYNGGFTSMDLAGHYFLTDGLSSTKHSLVAQGANAIPAGAYALIVQDPTAFKADFPSYSGLMFDSSWSGLTSSAGKTLAVVDAQGGVLDQVTYDPTIGGTNDGNSLQKDSSGTWKAAAPTPGTAFQSGSGTDTTGGAGSTGSGDGSDAGIQQTGGLPVEAEQPAPPPKKTPSYDHIRAELAVPKTTVTGIAASVSAKVFGYSGELRTYGAFHIAFGDGTEAQMSAGKPIEHTYNYPGTYAVVFAYRENPYAALPDATAQASVKVADPTLAVSSVDADGAVTIANSGTTDAELSGWSLVSKKGKQFTFPSGTVLLAGAHMVLPISVTGFGVDRSAVSLQYPSGSMWASFVQPDPNHDTVQTQTISPDFSVASPSAHAEPHAAVGPPAPVRVAAIPEHTQLAAAAVVAQIAKPKPSAKPKKHSLIPYVALLGVLVGIAAYLFHKYGAFSSRPHAEHTENVPDETETVPVEISAEPVRIVEE